MPGNPHQQGLTMKRIAVLLIMSVICFTTGAATGWILNGVIGDRPITIAMSWGDGKYGKQFYGAQVYLVPQGEDYAVHARVQIGPGNPYYHDCGQIGRAASVQDAVERFGTIRWDEKGVTIGDLSAGGYHLPRARVESHR